MYMLSYRILNYRKTAEKLFERELKYPSQMACHANMMSSMKASYLGGPAYAPTPAANAMANAETGNAETGQSILNMLLGANKEKIATTPLVPHQAPVGAVAGVTAVSSNQSNMIRFLYTIPNENEVDIYLNSKLVMSGVPYGTLSDYLRVPSGSHNLLITPTGSKVAVLSGKISLVSGDKYTVLITGNPSNTQTPLAMFLMKDEKLCPLQGKALLRVVHTAAGAPNVDVYVNRVRTLENIAFGRAGEPVYLSLDAGGVDVGITATGTSKVLLGPLPIMLREKHVYTIYTSGVPGHREYPFGALVSDDAKNFCMYM